MPCLKLNPAVLSCKLTRRPLLLVALLLATGIPAGGQTLQGKFLRDTAARYREQSRYPSDSWVLQPGQSDSVKGKRTTSPVSVVDKGIQVSVWAGTLGFEAPEPVDLFATLSSGVDRLAAESLVGDVVKDAGDSIGHFTFADDGEGADAVAGDGIYSARLDWVPAPDLAEAYSVRVEAVAPGGHVLHVNGGFLYCSPWARLTGQYRDALNQGNVVVSAEVDVKRVGRFHLRGTLHTMDGQPLGVAQKAIELGTGRHWIDLTYFGLMFHDRRAAGPFRVGSLALQTSGSVPGALSKLAENVHVTQAYQLADLRSTPFDRADLIETAERLDAQAAQGERALADQANTPVTPPCLIFVHGAYTNGSGDNWQQARDYWKHPSGPATDFVETALNNSQSYYVVGYDGNQKWIDSRASGSVAEQIKRATEGWLDRGGNACGKTYGAGGTFIVIAHSMGALIMDYILGNDDSNDPSPNYVVEPNGTPGVAPFNVVAPRINYVISLSGAHRGSQAADSCVVFPCFPAPATIWMQSYEGRQVRTWSNPPARTVYLTGGYDGMSLPATLSFLLSNLDDGAVQYASIYACEYADHTYSNSNVCDNPNKQETSGFINLDAANEDHTSIHDASIQSTRKAIPGGVWECGGGGTPCTPGATVQNAMSTAQFVSLLVGTPLGPSLQATPASGTAPLTTTLAASVTGSNGTINYTIWWDCADPGTSVSQVMAGPCGNIPTTCTPQANGIKCDNVQDNTKTVDHTYTTAGTYTAKVIVERGDAAPGQAQAKVTVQSAGLTTVNWIAGPPAYTTSGQTFPVSWQILNAASFYDARVQWDPSNPTTITCGGSNCSASQGTVNGGGVTLTAPTVTAPTALKYVVHFRPTSTGPHYFTQLASTLVNPSTNPVVTITTPASNPASTTTSPFYVAGSASGGSGVTLVRWTNASGGAGTASGTTWWTTYIPVVVGTNLITVTAVDSLGRTGSATLTVTLSGSDTTPPVISITSPASGGIYTTSSSPLSMTGTASDPESGVGAVTWATDRGQSGGASGTASWTIAGVPLAPGVNQVTVTAHNLSGLVSSRTLTVQYTPADVSPPTLVQIDPCGGGCTTSSVRNPVRFAGTASDDVGVAYVRWTNQAGGSGTAAGTANWYADVPVVDGLNIVAVQAWDAAGRGSNVITTWLYASSPTPALQITVPTTNPTWGTTANSITLQGTASAPLGLASLIWTNDRGGSGSVTPSANWTIASIPLQPGENLLTVTAADPEGHFRSAVITVTYTVPQAANITWITKASLVGALNEPGAYAAIGDRIYVEGVQRATSMDVYDTSTDTWNGAGALADGPAILNGAATIGGKMYAVGFVGADTTWTLCVYDPVSDSWVGEASTVPRRQWPGVVAVGGKLLVFGGLAAAGRVDEYDSQTHLWQTRAPMPTPRSQMGIAIVGGKVYTVGGITDGGGFSSRVTDVYDPATDTWATLPDQIIPNPQRPQRRTAHGAAVVNGRIYAVGGHDDTWPTIPMTESEEYIQAAGWWRAVNVPAQAHYFPATATVNGKIYVIGGLISNGQGAPGSVEEGTVTPDPAPPVVRINQPTTDPTWATNSPSVALAGPASDNVVVQTLTWANDRGGSGAVSRPAWKHDFSWWIDTIALQMGDSLITVTAVDADNNSTVATLLVNYSLPVSPQLTSLAINGGLGESPSRTVTLNNIAIGIPLEFLASEQPDFTGASWQAYAVAPKFLLSPGNGWKIVYLKVRNAAGESAVVSGAINLQQTAAGVGTFTTGATVACSAGEYHRLAVGADGTVHVLCWYGAFGASGYQLGLHRSTDGGVSFGSAIPIPGSKDVTSGLDMSIDGSGVVHIAWSDNAAGSEAYYSRSLDGGSTFTAPVRVRSGIAWGGYEARQGWGGGPHVVSNGGGVVYVAFPASTYNAGGSYIGPVLWMAKSTNGGVSFGPEFPLYQPTVDSGFALKRLRVFGGEFRALYWRSMASHPAAYFLRGTAGNLGNLPVNINPTASDYWAEDLAVTPVGSTIHAVVREIGNDSALYALQSQDSGASWGARVRVDDNNTLVDRGRLEIDNRGALHFVVRGLTPTRVLYTYSTDGAQTFSLPVAAIAPALVQVIASAVDTPRALLYLSTNVASGQIAIARGSIAPDFDAPAVTIAYPTSQPTLTTGAQRITLTGLAVDASGVTQVRWANSRGGSGLADGTTDWQAVDVALQPGDNVVTIIAVDPSGNAGSDTLTVTYAPETTPPTVTITSPTSNSAYSTGAASVALGGIAGDNVALSEVRWASQFGPWGTAAGTTSWTTPAIPLQAGANQITVTAFDTAGNSQTDTITVTYVPPDTTAPVVAITAPTSAATFVTAMAAIDMAGFAGDDVGVTQVTCINDRGGACTVAGTAAWTVTALPLSSGFNAITVTAQDGTGNAAAATIVIERTLTGSADLSLTLADDADPIPVFGGVTYTASYTNTGPADASGTMLSLTLPVGMSFVSSVPGTPTCTESGRVVNCSVGSLAAGGGGTVTVTASADAGTLGSVTVSATVTAAQSDPTAGNNADSESTLVKFQKGDLQNDLATDLFLGNTVTHENRVWLMNEITQLSEQTFNPATAASVTQLIVGVDDFDGDHRNDLVFWNSATGVVEFWLMNGVNRIGAPVPPSAAPTLTPSWKLSATADFNADGRPDVVWRNFTSQKIVIWTMNGTAKVGNIIPTPDQAVAANWEIVGAFDMNGDGTTDFLWYNSTSGKIVYWWMNAAVQRIAGNFTNPANAGANNWKVLAAGDYGVGPGGVAGTADVIWRNASSGRYVVWYLDLAGNRTFGTFTTPNQPASNPTDWTIVGPR